MKHLSDCPQESAEYARAGRYRGAIVDLKTKQRLELVSDEPFVAYSFHDDIVEWGTGRRPDGVLVALVEGCAWMCFVELKGKDNPVRAFSQLEDGARHFAPVGRLGESRTHGDEHHDQWSGGTDVPVVEVSSDHRAVGLFVTFRALARSVPPPPVVIAGKAFACRAIQLPKKHPNRAEASPRQLLEMAGLVPPE